jgi:hypothetical protein
LININEKNGRQCTSDISNPIAEPVGPTFPAARKTSMPPPDPRSTTLSPYRFRVSALHSQEDNEELVRSHDHLLDVCGGYRITTT